MLKAGLRHLGEAGTGCTSAVLQAKMVLLLLACPFQTSAAVSRVSCPKARAALEREGLCGALQGLFTACLCPWRGIFLFTVHLTALKMSGCANPDERRNS